MQGIAGDLEGYYHFLDALKRSAFGNNSTLTLYRTTQLTTWCFWLYWNLAGASLSMDTPGGPLWPTMVDAPRLVSSLHIFDLSIAMSRMYGVPGLSSWYVEAGGMGSLLPRTPTCRLACAAHEASPILPDTRDPYGASVPPPLGITSTSET